MIVVPEAGRTRRLPHGTGERFLIDTVYVPHGENLCRVYDHELALRPIGVHEFEMRLRLRHGGREDAHRYTVRVDRDDVTLRPLE